MSNLNHINSNLPEIVLIEDSVSLARVYQEYIKSDDWTITTVSTGAEALEIIESRQPQVVLLDLRLPDMDGMEILKRVKDAGISTSMIVITADASASLAVESMRAGAFDYLEKPFTRDRIGVTVRNAIEHQRLANLVDTYVTDDLGDNYFGFIGSSKVMQSVYRIIDSAAESKATVFITGESGTGKEVCAQAIHDKSQRRDQEFVALNCAAIPRDLMESEIFGHVKGAFTGAHASREGAASKAHGGTLFLDEIGEMDLDLQSKLLRFVQLGSFHKVGSNKLESVDVRIVCATNRDPLEIVKQGQFREDLYYRLHVIPIELPSLRDRGNDVLDIARTFLGDINTEEAKDFESFSQETEDIFMAYRWPGNIRQLQNVIRNIVVLNNDTVVTPEMLPPPLNGETADEMAHHAESPHMTQKVVNYDGPVHGELLINDSVQNSLPPTVVRREVFTVEDIKELWQVERDTIISAIKVCGDNIPKAAKYLGVSPSTIYRKRQSWIDNGRWSEEVGLSP